MTLLHDIDYGTPAVESTATVTLAIDGRTVTVPAGTSIMRAAAEAGIGVPKLCATDSLKSFGSCRLCLGQVDGRKGFPAACTTPAEAGMRGTTQNAKLGEVGRDGRYGYSGANHLGGKKDLSNPYFEYDASKCIVCSRCVRACEEVQGTFALTIASRGFGSRVSPGQMESFMDSECVSCGACVQACPTAALMEKTVGDAGTAEHSVVTTCAYCGVGCAFEAEMKGGQVVRMTPYKDGKAN